MLLKLWCMFSLIGLLKGTTTSSAQGCYTKTPGRIPTCVDKYAVMPDNLYCQKFINRHPLSVTERNETVRRHNDIRSTVSPKAANMLPLKYNEGLGRTAQIWAEMCQLKPSKPLQRFRPGSYEVGENVYVSQTNLSWSDVIDIWLKENSSFTHGSGKNQLSQVSNYAQLVWAKTSAVGCSKAICSGQYFYVCHYAPAMNYSNIDTPYESSNQSCSQCRNCTNALCDCRGIICLNGAEINYTTCYCDCIANVKTYELPACQLNCDTNGDDANVCGTVYMQSTCRSNFETMYHCPWMCDICPYAGKGYNISVPLPWERNRTECAPPTTISKSTIRPGATAGIQSSHSAQTTFQTSANPVLSTTTTSRQITTTGTQSSKSAQMKTSQCRNGAAVAGYKKLAFAFALMLTFFYIVK